MQNGIRNLFNELKDDDGYKYHIPRNKGWEGELFRLFDACDPNRDWDYIEFENGVFYVTPYYWGECTCGWDFIDNDHERLRNLEHRPECYQTEYDRIEEMTRGDLAEELRLLKPIFEKYGWDTTEDDWWYSCAGHCTCDYIDRYKEIIDDYAREFGRKGHDPDCLLVRPNFYYKPIGFGIRWYKHPLRDAYMNKNISFKEFRKIINSCIESIELH